MKREKIINVEKVNEVFCDKCGIKISDGLYNGTDRVNFWGHYLRFLPLENIEVLIDIPEYPGITQLRLSQRYGRDIFRTFVLCTECALAEYRDMKERFTYYEEPEVKEKMEKQND